MPRNIGISNYLKTKLSAIKNSLTHESCATSLPEDESTPLNTDLYENLVMLREKYQNSADFLTREINIQSVKVTFIMIEGMVNIQTISEMIIEPLLNEKFTKKTDCNAIYDFVYQKSVLAVDQADIYTCEELFKFIMSGFVVILIDGMNKGITLGMQGFSFRSIGEPASEMNERGSREGFTEPLRINMTMVRRRMKSPKLKFELLTVGATSKTDLCLMYMTDKVSAKLLRQVKRQLKAAKLDIALSSGYIMPFLQGNPASLFSDVGITERPDVLCAKINEGRIAVIMDGTPYAVIVPYLFTENFQTLDDYSHKSYYATFIRLLKYFSFALAILLPGLYVAIGTYHPELLPSSLLFNIAASEEITPFPLFVEALIIHFLYEIMREAGLRLPRPVGHAVSIVGGLVIGDASVSAGLIGAPMVLIVALTAITSFVIPTLYEPVSILRFAFILVGGFMGLYGIALLIMIVLVNICSLNNFGMPYMSPLAPFSLTGMRDTFVRMSFKTIGVKNVKLQDLDGSKINSESEE